MLTPNSYPFGSLIRFSVAFTQVGTTTPVDPTDVALSILQLPNASQVFTYLGGQIIRDGVGLYHYDFLPSAPGRWQYAFKGTGAVEAGTVNALFTVENSNFAGT